MSCGRRSSFSGQFGTMYQPGEFSSTIRFPAFVGRRIVHMADRHHTLSDWEINGDSHSLCDALITCCKSSTSTLFMCNSDASNNRRSSLDTTEKAELLW